jgi:anhydro-N-acetylmuramic acid kinase
MSGKVFCAIGLMSGTSCDGVDAAYIETNGHGFVAVGEAITLPFDPLFRSKLKSVLGMVDHEKLPAITQQLTELHARAVDILLTQIGKTTKNIDVIGFHGQTIFHDPANKKTLQIGDGALLAKLTGIDTVNDFRSADVAAGGQGAPLVPLYHAAIAHNFPKPCAIVNIGGVANVTYLDSTVIAFDCGPGNALIDDAMLESFGLPYDADGGIGAMGTADEKLLAAWLSDEFFSRDAPKSLDRNHFKFDLAELMPDDAVATLTEFTARSIIQSAALLPQAPLTWIITGGGRKNHHLMQRLAAATDAPVRDIAEMGFDGDAIEAQAFGYLAVRHKLNLPLSLPMTTGVPQPMCGGKFYAALG